MSKKVLGLDLGSTSIGWAFIEEGKNKSNILKTGVRIIPYSADEKDQFTKGQAISVNKDRTLMRTARKTNHRYKLRKQNLINLLIKNEMLPDDISIKKIDALSLYGLRAKSINQKIELKDLGRILLLLNQKRGYKSSRTSPEQEGDKKISDYLNEIKERKETLEKSNLTIGEYFYKMLLEDRQYRIKKNVFPRECYVEEFNKIWDCQHKYYPEILTSEKKVIFRDEIIFYQRKLKSQKGLVGKCNFELHHKVTPKSSPLFQFEKIWESINTITLTNKYNERFEITLEKKKEIFNHLDQNEKLTKTDLLKILGLKRTDGWYPNEQIDKAGLQGNTTKSKIIKTFQKLNIKRDDLLRFELNLKYNNDTGEILQPEMVDAGFEKEPLYRLWHLLYSVDESKELINILKRDYHFSDEEAEELNKIDFKKQGFGNKSARALRKLIPGLMQGLDYSKAAEIVGYNHSNSLTIEENLSRELKDKLSQYPKNSLRQPVVEKIMNQLVNVINAILENESLGRPDEIRIELARELKQSQEERNKTFSNNIKSDKEHKQIVERIETEYPGIKANRKVIEKYKLFEQQEGICLYSGKNMELSKVLKGEGIDVDHIIPQSRLFDDSFQNKILVYRIENENKGNSTAYDYINSKSKEKFEQYIETVNRLFESKKITKSKQRKLLMSESDIPDDFINRQLNETRYISKEATKLLKDICHNVYSTSGSVTEFLRSQWGYNEVLQQLNLEKYELVDKVKDGKIEGWSKRDDHRHHAVDALVVATTKQKFIQQLNKLNSSVTRDEMIKEINGKVSTGWQARKSLLEQYIQTQQPFSTQEVKEAISQILISIKPGKKVASLSYNKAIKKKTLIPRGQLHKEQIYGKIKRYAKTKTPLNSKFKSTELIASEIEKRLVIQRLSDFNNDVKLAFKDLDKNPIWINIAKSRALTEVTLWEEHFVYKYPLSKDFKEKDIEYIVDIGIRKKVRARFEERRGDKDHPLKNINEDPIWLNRENRIPITSVRCMTGLDNLVPLHVSENGITMPLNKKSQHSKPVDFVSTRNNHHFAIYMNNDGKLVDISVSLWDAVERKKIGIPVVVINPKKTWDFILSKGIDNQNILTNLPKDDWQFITSLQQNEYFIFNIKEEEIEKLLENKDFSLINKNLYRVQKISKKSSGSFDMYFRNHLETSVDDNKNGGEMDAKKMGKIIVIQSLKSFEERNPIKVKINHLGEINLV